jgi:hypothetical protein
MPKYYSIDVECVATGTDHNSRSVAQISLIDQNEQVVLNAYVQPSKPVVSHLSPLTGLTKERLDSDGIPIEKALDLLKSLLPKDAILVGQNIGKDVEWLGLKQETDFESMMDLAGLYRVWNPKYNTWSVFGQDHVAKVLLGWDSAGASHDAVTDAIKSMRLFNHYLQMKDNADLFDGEKQKLLAVPVEASFAKRFPTFEGVCMGNRRQCSCGAPFFGG